MGFTIIVIEMPVQVQPQQQQHGSSPNWQPAVLFSHGGANQVAVRSSVESFEARLKRLHEQQSGASSFRSSEI